MESSGDKFDVNLKPCEVYDIIGNIYHSVLTNKWVDVLDRIIDSTQSNKAFFVIQRLCDPNPLLLEFQTLFDYSPNILKEYHRRFKEDPFYNVTKVEVEGESLNVNDYLDVNSLKETEFYKNFLAPLKSYHCLTGILIRDGKWDSTFSINRDEFDQPYSQQDLNLLKLLTPHFSCAAHTYHTLKLYKNYSNISKSILDQSDRAILVCDEDCRVILCNEFANENLVIEKSMPLTGEILQIMDPFNNAKFKRYVKQCTSFSFTDIHYQETILIVNDKDTESMLLTLSPLIHNHATNDIDIPCCLVSITFQHTLNWSAFAKEFGLTNREQHLLKAIYSRKKLNELTTLFNVSYNTLRVHLQSIFKKVEVNSQTELMIILNLFKG